MTFNPNGVESGRIQPSLLPVLRQGLDLSRCVPGKVLGTHVAASAAAFEAGQFVTRNADGQIVLCTGLGVVGMAKWNKATALTGLVKAEAIVLTATDVIPLKHPLVAGVLVTTVAGVTIAAAGNYTLNATNGTIARIGGVIADGDTVLVTYRFTAQASDLEFAGRNFFNLIDETALQQGRIAVIQGLSNIFTANYDQSVQYAVGQLLYCDANGRPTNLSAGGGDVVGHVSQLPTADDPYLGFEMLSAVAQ